MLEFVRFAARLALDAGVPAFSVRSAVDAEVDRAVAWRMGCIDAPPALAAPITDLTVEQMIAACYRILRSGETR